MNDGVLKYGEADASSVDMAKNNFARASISVFSYCTTPIELLSNDGNDTVLSTATGFFWKRNGKSYLVTNYHVVTGRNPLSGELISNNGYIPERLSFYGSEVISENGEVEFRRHKHMFVANNDYFEKLEAPIVSGNVVDLWAMPIGEHTVFGADKNRLGFDKSEMMSCYINEVEQVQCTTGVGDDCFILGYPVENYAGAMMPIWKRGSISSETLIGVDKRPIFLIDASTTHGMSGSPILRKMDSITMRDKVNGYMFQDAFYNVIGVYGGQLLNRELGRVNIGYGWYQSVIDELIDTYAGTAQPLVPRQINFEINYG